MINFFLFLLVDEIKLKKVFAEQKESFAELNDKMQALGESLDHLNAENQRIYTFIADCPLRKYISEKRLFNGHPFVVYENQFKMYCRIVNDGGRDDVIGAMEVGSSSKPFNK